MIPAQLALDNAYDAELEYTVSSHFDCDVHSRPLEYHMRYPYTLALTVKDRQMIASGVVGWDGWEIPVLWRTTAAHEIPAPTP